MMHYNYDTIKQRVYCLQKTLENISLVKVSMDLKINAKIEKVFRNPICGLIIMQSFKKIKFTEKRVLFSISFLRFV